jgi:hypothetical protein
MFGSTYVVLNVVLILTSALVVSSTSSSSNGQQLNELIQPRIRRQQSRYLFLQGCMRAIGMGSLNTDGILLCRAVLKAMMKQQARPDKHIMAAQEVKT